MGTKLHDDIPTSAHRGEPDTTTKITEIFNEIYDNQWADAMEGLSSFSERKAVKILLGSLMECHTICREVGALHLEYLQLILRTPNVSRSTFLSYFRPMYNKRNASTTRKLLKECQHLVTPEAVEDIMMKKIVVNRNIDTAVDRNFIKKCLELCWLMNLKDPPMTFGIEAESGEKFDYNQYREYTVSGTVVDYTVWPPLLLYINGPILCKGVAQPVKRSKPSVYVPLYPELQEMIQGKSDKKDQQETDSSDRYFDVFKTDEQRAKLLRPDRTDRIRRTRSPRYNDFTAHFPNSSKIPVPEGNTTSKIWQDDQKLQDIIQKKNQAIESLQEKLKQQEEFTKNRHILSKKLERINDMNKVLSEEKAKMELELQKKQSELNKAKEEICAPIKTKKEILERIRIAYEELYNNDWHSALTDPSLYSSRSAVRTLLDILKACYQFCEMAITAQAESLQQILKPTTDEAADGDSWSPWTVTKQNTLKNCKKLIAEEVTDHDHIAEAFIEKNQDKLQQVKTVFVKKCFKICWSMNVQDPPVVIAKEAIQGEKFDLTKYKTYDNLSARGCVVEYTVWPPLFHGGFLLCAGVAKPIHLGKSMQVPITKVKK